MNDTLDPKVKPHSTSGTISIAGEEIPVKPDSVESSPGAKPEDLLNGLKEAAKEGVFTQPENKNDEASQTS